MLQALGTNPKKFEKLQRTCCKKCYKKIFGYFVNKKKSYEFRKI